MARLDDSVDDLVVLTLNREEALALHVALAGALEFLPRDDEAQVRALGALGSLALALDAFDPTMAWWDTGEEA